MIVATLIAANQFDTIREASGKPGNFILMPFNAEGGIQDMARTMASLYAFRQNEASALSDNLTPPKV